MYSYKIQNDKGEMQIQYQEGEWQLEVFGQPVGTYRSASTAAWAVSDRQTGHPAWDNLQEVSAPPSINSWDIYEV